MPSVYLARSPIHGTGVFACRRFAPGEPIGVIDDARVVTPEDPLDPGRGEFDIYCDRLPDGTEALMRSPERHINHSCAPTVFVYSVERRRYVLAMGRLEAGEELTFDYALNAVGGDLWTCQCGAAECRGRHVCDFFQLPRPQQLRYLPYLDPWFAQEHAEKVAALLRDASTA